MIQWMMCQHIKIRLEERTSDLIRLIIDIGLKRETLDKPWGNYRQIL